MKTSAKLFSSITALILLLSWSTAWAQWELDSERSTLNFVSIKNNSVAETHSFKSLVGFIGKDGHVQLAIDLDSVDTLIPIRDERMRELLFETARFPSAKVSAQVDPAVVAAAAEGGVLTTELALQLSLHDMQRTLTVPVVVVGEGGDRLRVFTARPVIVNAAQFGLDGGIEALRKIAGLDAISEAVPVTLELLFVPAQD